MNKQIILIIENKFIGITNRFSIKVYINYDFTSPQVDFVVDATQGRMHFKGIVFCNGIYSNNCNYLHPINKNFYNCNNNVNNNTNIYNSNTLNNGNLTSSLGIKTCKGTISFW